MGAGGGCPVCAGVLEGWCWVRSCRAVDVCLMVLQRCCLCPAGVGASTLGLPQRCYPVESLVEEHLCWGSLSVAVILRFWVGGNTVLVSAACGFGVPVKGLIVAVRAEGVVIEQQPEGMAVVPRHQLARWLLRRADFHRPERLEAVYEAARGSTTWR